MSEAHRFEMGQVVATPGAMEALEAEGLHPYGLLTRHVAGDWGDTDAHDTKANEEALLTGARLVSSYKLEETGVRVWVITEADRSATTLLLPTEY